MITGLGLRIHGANALVPGPGLKERTTHAEALPRKPLFPLGNGPHGMERCDRRIVLDQAHRVLGKDGGHPDRVVHGQADGPAKQQLVRGVLHRHALRVLHVLAGTAATLDIGLHETLGRELRHLAEQSTPSHRAAQDRMHRILMRSVIRNFIARMPRIANQRESTHLPRE